MRNINKLHQADSLLHHSNNNNLPQTTLFNVSQDFDVPRGTFGNIENISADGRESKNIIGRNEPKTAGSKDLSHPPSTDDPPASEHR